MLYSLSCKLVQLAERLRYLAWIREVRKPNGPYSMRILKIPTD